MDYEFYKNKKVLITGHTGFKGSWLSKILINLGANVVGYSLDSPTSPNLYNILSLKKEINSITGDIRDFNTLNLVINKEEPEIILHLAAQPLVRESYENPLYTYETNVMGTVNLLESIRLNKSVKSFLNITTDKVYYNNEWEWGYRETDNLNGFDPYSNSKSCSELVTDSYRNSFFKERNIAISTARAGNVIGGGDFAKDRIIPDCYRAASLNQEIIIRNQSSVRPYQHVLEPLFAYLMICQMQYENKSIQNSYNIGPDDSDCITTGQLVNIFCENWGENTNWINKSVDGPHEANFLKLDCSKLKKTFNWKPKWNVEQAVEKTVDWYKCYKNNENIVEITNKQINCFINS